MAKISFKKTGEGSGEFQPIPAGTYGASLRAIWVMGTQVSEAFGSKSVKAIFEWEVDYNPNNATKNQTVWQFVNIGNAQGILTSGSAAGKMLLGWLGEEFFEKNPDFEIPQLLDRFASLVLTVNEKGKNEVTGVGPINPKLKFEQTCDAVSWDVREDLELVHAGEVNKWILEQAKKSLEYQLHTNGQILLPDPPKNGSAQPLPEIKPGSDSLTGGAAPDLAGTPY